MQVGVVFPQTEIGADPGAVREYVQAVEDLGYSHIFIADHVLGADPRFHPELQPIPYTHESVIHEPFILMGYMAAVTKTVGLATGVLILPQRQTALVAKQAAEVDVLSGGRVRLGVGIGWNPVEYEALGEDFHTRGRRIEEQIDVLRALWTEEVVDFHGRWHQISHAGLNPLPVQRPIPIWIAAGSSTSPIPPDQSLRRIVRLGDGWCPMFRPSDESQEAITRLYQFSAEAGRDPSSLPIEGRVWLANNTPEEWADQVRDWERLGVTRLVVDARMGRTWSQRPLSDHLNGLQEFKEVVAW